MSDANKDSIFTMLSDEYKFIQVAELKNDITNYSTFIDTHKRKLDNLNHIFLNTLNSIIYYFYIYLYYLNKSKDIKAIKCILMYTKTKFNNYQYLYFNNFTNTADANVNYCADVLLLKEYIKFLTLLGFRYKLLHKDLEINIKSSLGKKIVLPVDEINENNEITIVSQTKVTDDNTDIDEIENSKNM
jgi:hypothetical protein